MRRDTCGGKRRPDRAYNHFDKAVTRDETANHHVITGIDETACADVGQLGIGALIQIISFYQSYPSRVVLAAQDRGVTRVIGRQGRHNGRFQVVPRWNAGRFNFALLTIFPVIIESDGGPLLSCTSKLCAHQ